jgi:hypothetical protein
MLEGLGNFIRHPISTWRTLSRGDKMFAKATTGLVLIGFGVAAYTKSDFDKAELLSEAAMRDYCAKSTAGGQTAYWYKLSGSDAIGVGMIFLALAIYDVYGMVQEMQQRHGPINHHVPYVPHSEFKDEKAEAHVRLGLHS